MKQYKVFLSSSQFNEEFNTEREALFVVFDKDNFKDRFKLWQIEDYSSPENISKHYIDNVNSSDILVLLIGSVFREAVYKEFKAAVGASIKIFCFIRSSADIETRTKEFIQEVRINSTSTNYNSFKDLVYKIESSFTDYYYTNSKEKPEKNDKNAEKKILDKNERALRILVGIFDSGNKEPTVELIIEKYIEFILCQVNTPKNLSEIKHMMTQLLPDISTNIFDDIDESIQHLEEKEIILRVDRKYKIVASKFDKIKDEFVLGNEIFNNIYMNYKDNITQDFDQFIETVKNCISQIIYKTASSTATISINGDFTLEAYGKEILTDLITQEIALLVDDNKDLVSVEKIIYEILRTNDLNIIHWINKVYKSYWILTLLDQNPEVIEFQRTYYENYILYLDSHIVIRTIVSAGSEVDLCQGIYSLCQKLKIELRLTDSLYNEVEKAFYSANMIYSRSGGDISRANELFNILGKKSDILEGYLLEKSRNPKLPWNSYINKYYSPINKNKLRNYIENELNIKIQERKDFSIEQWADIENIKEILLNKRHIKSCPEDSLEYERYNRELILRTNEARQISIIYQQRASDGSGDYWFVTFDQYVYRTNADLLTLDDQIYDSPCYLKPARLLEMLLQVPEIDGDINTFRSILLSDDIHKIANSIEIEIISEMLDKRMDKQITDRVTLKNMYSDIISRPIIEEAYNEYLTAQNESSKEIANRNVVELISTTLLEKFHELLNRTNRLEKEVLEQARKSDKHRKRTKYFKAQLRRETKKK